MKNKRGRPKTERVDSVLMSHLINKKLNYLSLTFDIEYHPKTDNIIELSVSMISNSKKASTQRKIDKLKKLMYQYLTSIDEKYINRINIIIVEKIQHQ